LGAAPAGPYEVEDDPPVRLSHGHDDVVDDHGPAPGGGQIVPLDVLDLGDRVAVSLTSTSFMRGPLS